MENFQHDLIDLHRRYLANTLTQEETELFFSLIREPENEALLKELMDARWDTQFEGIAYSPTKTNILLLWLRTMAAAIVLVLLSGIVYQLFKKTNPPAVLSQKERFKNDVQPGTDKAILKLADGSIITLDSSAKGELAIQGRQEITGKDGALYYNKMASGIDSVLYNEVITPAGGQYRLILADGTKVWLDALSSIHFPISFPGAIREVEITGQVYFEVAPSHSPGGGEKKQPFIVHIIPSKGGKAAGGQVEVLGTHFNINAFDDESIKTTLVEGKVKVSSMINSKWAMLNPGQQAIFGQSGKSPDIMIQTPDMQEVLAWKDGLFYYNGADIETIMQQVSRWYGVQVYYKDVPKEKFVAEIPRTVPLSTLLSLLELTKQVHFKIEGKTITVMQ